MRPYTVLGRLSHTITATLDDDVFDMLLLGISSRLAHEWAANVSRSFTNGIRHCANRRKHRQEQVEEERVFFVILTIVSLAFGALIGRFPAALLPIPLLALYYLGLLIGWWGNGVGELWGAAMGLAMALAVVSAGVGVVIRQHLIR